MNATVHATVSSLALEYEAILGEYFRDTGEAALERAYELGRRALADGLGVLDMARFHHEALQRMPPGHFNAPDALKGAEKVFIESVAPFEMTHRGFRDAYTALVTERRRAHQTLRQLNDRLEDEAKRIAHALHDEAGQMLASVYLTLAEIAGELPAAREPLERIGARLDQVGEQLRRLSHELRPVILDDFGLVAALEFLAQGVSTRTGLAVTVRSSLEQRLPQAIETALYRILQEALANASKHARAARVQIEIARHADMVNASIRDDGIGLDLPRLYPQAGRRGLGLIGMQERLKGIDGTLEIISGVDQGTTIEIRVPVHAGEPPTAPDVGRVRLEGWKQS
jgi:signal transduction histidine kinase